MRVGQIGFDYDVACLLGLWNTGKIDEYTKNRFLDEFGDAWKVSGKVSKTYSGACFCTSEVYISGGVNSSFMS